MCSVVLRGDREILNTFVKGSDVRRLGRKGVRYWKNQFLDSGFDTVHFSMHAIVEKEPEDETYAQLVSTLYQLSLNFTPDAVHCHDPRLRTCKSATRRLISPVT